MGYNPMLDLTTHSCYCIFSAFGQNDLLLLPDSNENLPSPSTSGSDSRMQTEWLVRVITCRDKNSDLEVIWLCLHTHDIS